MQSPPRVTGIKLHCRGNCRRIPPTASFDSVAAFVQTTFKLDSFTFVYNLHGEEVRCDSPEEWEVVLWGGAGLGLVVLEVREVASEEPPCFPVIQDAGERNPPPQDLPPPPPACTEEPLERNFPPSRNLPPPPPTRAEEPSCFPAQEQGGKRDVRPAQGLPSCSPSAGPQAVKQPARRLPLPPAPSARPACVDCPRTAFPTPTPPAPSCLPPAPSCLPPSHLTKSLPDLHVLRPVPPAASPTSISCTLPAGRAGPRTLPRLHGSQLPVWGRRKSLSAKHPGTAGAHVGEAREPCERPPVVADVCCSLSDHTRHLCDTASSLALCDSPRQRALADSLRAHETVAASSAALADATLALSALSVHDTLASSLGCASAVAASHQWAAYALRDADTLRSSALRHMEGLSTGASSSARACADTTLADSATFSRDILQKIMSL